MKEDKLKVVNLEENFYHDILSQINYISLFT